MTLHGLLADHNIEGHFRALIRIWNSPEWRDLWKDLNLAVESFSSLGLSPDVNDADLWQICQSHRLVLITANRNDEGSDSLESAIAMYNSETSLPVLTLANPTRFDRNRNYAGEVAEKALDYLSSIDDYRGTGRLTFEAET